MVSVKCPTSSSPYDEHFLQLYGGVNGYSDGIGIIKGITHSYSYAAQTTCHNTASSMQMPQNKCKCKSRYPRRISSTIYTPGIGTLFYSLMSSGENSAFTHFCCSYSQSLQFRFLVPPATHHCWLDRGSMIWKACPTPPNMAQCDWSPATHPSTNWAQRCLTSVIWWELVTIGPCTIFNLTTWGCVGMCRLAYTLITPWGFKITLNILNILDILVLTK